MRYCISLLALLACLSAHAQADDPVIEIDHEAEAGYRDSVARHDDWGAILHYQPHRCQNRYGRYGWVDKYHRVVIPFKYSALSPYYKQRIVVCREGPEKGSAFDFEGRVIIPEGKFYNIWLFNDSTLAVQDFNRKDLRTFDLQGKPIKTWAYSHILQFPSGRFRAYRDTLIGLGFVSTQGLLDPDGKVLIPLEYTSIEWEQGDMLPPDPLGNFTFWEGASWEQARAGLMDAQFKVIFPPAYLDIRFLDEKGHYTPHAGRSNRGYRRGIGNAKGQVVIDTVLLGFESMVNISYDTLPFLVFEDALSGKKGLWHRQAGQLRVARFDRFDGVSSTTFIQEKGDTSYLFHIDGRQLAGPYYRISQGRVDGYLVARPTLHDEYILLDMEGRFIRQLESEPRRLADGIYVMGRYGDKRSGYGQVKEYGLFDRDLNPITGLIFDMEPHAMDGLNTSQKIRVLDREHPAGYGPWVGYMREGLEETFTLIDGTGKTFEIKAD